MRLSPEFGRTYCEIEADSFRIDRKVEMLLSAGTPYHQQVKLKWIGGKLLAKVGLGVTLMKFL